MIEVRSPEHLTISELLQEAHQEIQVYLRKQPTVGACAFELFRRAIGQHDEQAWVCLYELCHVAVGSWVLRRLPAVQREDLEPLVNGSAPGLPQVLHRQRPGRSLPVAAGTATRRATPIPRPGAGG